MKKLYEDKEFYNDLSVRAKAHITKVLSMERAAGRMKARFEEIYRELEKNEENSNR